MPSSRKAQPQHRVEDLESHILETFASPGYKPPELPRVALEMLALSHQVDVPLERISAMLQRDPVLASNVLKLARSAHHARGSPIASFQAAVVRLGVGTLRNLVLETALNARVFRSKVFEAPMERLRCHSLAVAHLAKLVAARAKLDGDTAYLGGLLHDVGIAGALLVLAPQAAVEPAVLWPALGAVHERVGSALIQLWGLPDKIQWLAQRHHQHEAGKTTEGLLAVIRTAELTAIRLGASIFNAGAPPELDFERPGSEAIPQARQTLSLKDSDVEAIGAEAARTLPKVDPELEKLLKARVDKLKAKGH